MRQVVVKVYSVVDNSWAKIQMDLDQTGLFGAVDNQEGSVSSVQGPLAAKILGMSSGAKWHWNPWPQKILTISSSNQVLTLENCYPAGQGAGTTGTGYVAPVGLGQAHTFDVKWSIVSVSP